MVQSVNGFTSFDGKVYSCDEYDIRQGTHWQEGDTINIYDKENGNLIYTQCSGSVSEFSETFMYDENGNLKTSQYNWYECGYEYTSNPELWHDGISNQLYRTTSYYNEDGKVALSTYDVNGDGILESISHYTHNDNGSYKIWTDRNMNNEYDDTDGMSYRDAKDSYLSEEEYNKLNGIEDLVEIQPADNDVVEQENDTEVPDKSYLVPLEEYEPESKTNVFQKIINFFKNLGK